MNINAGRKLIIGIVLLIFVAIIIWIFTDTSHIDTAKPEIKAGDISYIKEKESIHVEEPVEEYAEPCDIDPNFGKIKVLYQKGDLLLLSFSAFYTEEKLIDGRSLPSNLPQGHCVHGRIFPLKKGIYDTIIDTDRMEREKKIKEEEEKKRKGVQELVDGYKESQKQ